MKLGQGGRFKRLTRQLRGRKGKKKVHDPGALAGWIGRRKYGAKRMAKWSAAGRKSVAVLDCLSDCDAILKAASDFTGPMRSCNVCGHTFRKELQECPKCGHTMPLHWTQKPSTVSKGAAGTFARRLGRAAYTVATLGQSPEETNYERKVEGKKPRKLESALSEPGQEWPEHDPGLWMRKPKTKMAKALAGVDASLSACDTILKRIDWMGSAGAMTVGRASHGAYRISPEGGGFRAHYASRASASVGPATSHIIGTATSRKEAQKLAEKHDGYVEGKVPMSQIGKAVSALNACDRILKQFGSVIPQGADRGTIPQGGDRGGPTGLGRSLFSSSRPSGSYSVTGGGSFVVHFKAKGESGWQKLSHHNSLKEAKAAIDKHGGGSHLVQAKGDDAATPFGTRGGANWRLCC